MLRKAILEVSALTVTDIVKFVPTFKIEHPLRSLGPWDIVVEKLGLTDKEQVYRRAVKLKLHAKIVPFTTSRLSAADTTLWNSNVVARGNVGGRKRFDSDASAQLRAYLTAHEGILDVDGWQTFALHDCPLLRLHGYSKSEVSWEERTFANQTRRRLV